MRNFEPFPILEADNFKMRKLTKADAAAIFKMRSNPEMMKFVPRPIFTEMAQAYAHIDLILENLKKGAGINWAIADKDSDQFMGIAGLYVIKEEDFRAEVGYMLLPEYWGKGIISTAIALMNNYGFEKLNLHSIEAIIDPGNFASEKALQKNGFIKEAHLVENIFWDGKFLDTVIYSLLKRNWELSE